MAANQDMSTLPAVLQARVQKDPDFRVYTFLRDGERDEESHTFADLHRRSRLIAEALSSACRPGDRVILLYPPGLEFICAMFGCWYAGMVAVPTYPPDPTRLARTLPRFQAVVRDSQASVVLTSSAILGMTQALWKLAPELELKRWLATDALPGEPTADPVRVKPDELGLIQYTSGSTGDPRGVMISHRNLVETEKMITKSFDYSTESKCVGWLPLYHDMGLIGNTLQPLFLGFPLVFMSPEHFLLRPMRWLHAVSRHRATTSGGPNFAFDLCARKATPADIEQLDLSSWRLAFNGSEPVRADTIERFTKTFAPSKFRPEAFVPCYGLAEATLIVSGGPVSALPVTRSVDAAALEAGKVVASEGTGATTRSLVGSGALTDGETVMIVDPTTGFPVPAGEIGEVWVSGPNVADGYWNRDEETERTFRAKLAFSGDRTFLRTGDLGFLDEQQELFITGRMKDLIIVRGRNIYPHDVERIVENSHPMFRPGCSAAFAVEVEGEERLVVAAEVRDEAQAKAQAPAIVEAVRKAIADEMEIHGHAVALLRPHTIPKTSSGKVQRSSCRASYLQGTLELVVSAVDDSPKPAAASAAPDGVEDPQIAKITAYLKTQVASLINTTPDKIDASAALGNLGLDSLAAAELSTAIEDDLGVRAYMSDMRSEETLLNLAERIVKGQR